MSFAVLMPISLTLLIPVCVEGRRTTVGSVVLIEQVGRTLVDNLKELGYPASKAIAALPKVANADALVVVVHDC